jgi:hypothetical protein
MNLRKGQKIVPETPSGAKRAAFSMWRIKIPSAKAIFSITALDFAGDVDHYRARYGGFFHRFALSG